MVSSNNDITISCRRDSKTFVLLVSLSQSNEIATLELTQLSPKVMLVVL